MRTIRVLGPITGQTYDALDTGESWNGAPVLAFRWADMQTLIQAGDGADGNGFGLAMHGGTFVDVTSCSEFEEVPTVVADVDGDALVLFVPQGRIWDEAPVNSTFTGIGYDAEDSCLACGEHISDPHSPECPAEVTSRLRQQAEESVTAHAAAIVAGGYVSGVCTTLTEGDEPAEVSHHLMALVQRVAADLIEMDYREAISLDTWPDAAELVAHLSGEADQWTA